MLHSMYSHGGPCRKQVRESTAHRLMAGSGSKYKARESLFKVDELNMQCDLTSQGASLELHVNTFHYVGVARQVP